MVIKKKFGGRMNDFIQSLTSIIGHKRPFPFETTTSVEEKRVRTEKHVSNGGSVEIPKANVISRGVPIEQLLNMPTEELAKLMGLSKNVGLVSSNTKHCFCAIMGTSAYWPFCSQLTMPWGQISFAVFPSGINVKTPEEVKFAQNLSANVVLSLKDALSKTNYKPTRERVLDFWRNKINWSKMFENPNMKNFGFSIALVFTSNEDKKAFCLQIGNCGVYINGLRVRPGFKTNEIISYLAGNGMMISEKAKVNRYFEIGHIKNTTIEQNSKLIKDMVSYQEVSIKSGDRMMIIPTSVQYLMDDNFKTPILPSDMFFFQMMDLLKHKSVIEFQREMAERLFRQILITLKPPANPDIEITNRWIPNILVYTVEF